MAGKKKTTTAAEWPLWSPEVAEGECKYLRLVSGEVLLIDPESCASHKDAAELRGVRWEVQSAGRVLIDRESKTVQMGERDSWTLRIKSAPGEQDAEAVQRALWPVKKAKARPRKCRKAS